MKNKDTQLLEEAYGKVHLLKEEEKLIAQL